MGMKSKRLVETDFGCRVAEAIAPELDRLYKALPKDKEHAVRRKAYEPKAPPEFVEGEKADISWISTKEVDHEGEVVLPEGIDLSIYQKNPVVLWSHDPGQ